MFSRLAKVLPPGLSQWIRTRKMRSRVRHHGSETLDRLAARVEQVADLGRIRNLRRKMQAVVRTDPTSAAKYTDYPFWLLLNVDRAGRLGLHQTSGLRVMDLGCGPGFFVAAARELGHECQGVDVPESFFTAVEREVYSELLASLKCSPHVAPLLIERFVPLPFEAGQFDLITAFWICFNRHRQPDEWGADEWKFFVDDARRCLRAGGRLFLELNEAPERYGDLQWYDAQTLAYFRSAGKVDRNCITVTRER